jgi:hypothetical protein
VATSPTVQLPTDAQSLIQTLSVTANGQNLDAGPGSVYNQLFILIADVQLGGKRNESAIAQLGADVPSQLYGPNGLSLPYPQPYLLHLPHNSEITCQFPQSIPAAMWQQIPPLGTSTSTTNNA